MFESLPLEGWIGIGGFVAAIVILALVHSIHSAVQSAHASRREADKLVTELKAVLLTAGHAVSAAAAKRGGKPPRSAASGPSSPPAAPHTAKPDCTGRGAFTCWQPKTPLWSTPNRAKLTNTPPESANFCRISASGPFFVHPFATHVLQHRAGSATGLT